MPVPHHSILTVGMPFLPPNQQRQSTEGISIKSLKETQSTDPNQSPGISLSSSIKGLLKEGMLFLYASFLTPIPIEYATVQV